jgi:hypothetical protein
MLSMRDAIYILGLVFCLADPAGAGWRPEEPPAEFAGPYEGKLTVRRVPLREIPGYCRNIKGVYGCAYWNTTPPACLIYIPDNVPPKLEAAIYAHELGHCNGWQHPYPGKLPEATKPVELKIDHEIAVKRARENPMCQEEPKPESCP